MKISWFTFRQFFNRPLIIIIMLSSNKPYMTKEVFSKFLYEKQRDSRLNEELYPPLRPDQVKVLIDKYEPSSSNSNRGESTNTINVHSKTEWRYLELYIHHVLYLNLCQIWLFISSKSLKNGLMLAFFRSDNPRGSTLLPNGAWDNTCDVRQNGPVPWHDPAHPSLLHQILAQHLSHW